TRGSGQGGTLGDLGQQQPSRRGGGSIGQDGPHRDKDGQRLQHWEEKGGEVGEDGDMRAYPSSGVGKVSLVSRWRQIQRREGLTHNPGAAARSQTPATAHRPAARAAGATTAATGATSEGKGSGKGSRGHDDNNDGKKLKERTGAA
ncbi:unnamed protein product, partial [Discosporangium mesarthrocarpum]